MRLPLPVLLCVVPAFQAAGARPSTPTVLQAQPPAADLQELKARIRTDNPAHPTASVAWAEAALRQLANRPDPDLEMWFLTSLVNDLNALGRYAEAEAYLARGRALASRLPDPRGGLRLEVAAASLLDAQEKPAEARATLDAVLPGLAARWARSPEDAELGRALGSAYRLEGSILQTLGRYPQAIAAYQKAQRISERMKDPRGQALVLDQMGTLYALLERPEEAIAAHQQALQLAADLSDLGLQASIRLDLANSFAAANQPDAQLAALRRTVEEAARAGDPYTQATALGNLADAYLRKRDYREALRHAEAALRIPDLREDPGSVAISNVNRGIALNRLGRHREGLKAMEEGLAHIQTTGAKSRIAEVTGNLAEEYAFAGDFRRAYELEVAFKGLSDELKRAEDQRHIARASAAFDSDRKQFEIEALRREQREQTRLILLWSALGVLGFTLAGLLVVNRRRLQRLNRALAEASLVDPLTGFRNRRYLALAMPEETARVLRGLRTQGHRPGGACDRLVFLMVDVDHFKLVNDTHGHAAGDGILIQVAQLLRSTCREADTLVRWGGEEFLVVARCTQPEQASTIAGNLREAFRDHTFRLPGGEPLALTCCVGYAPYPPFPDHPTALSWEATAEGADHCLYAAKRSGRDGWVGLASALEPPPASVATHWPARIPELIQEGWLRVATSHADPAELTWVARLGAHD